MATNKLLSWTRTRAGAPSLARDASRGLLGDCDLRWLAGIALCAACLLRLMLRV